MEIWVDWDMGGAKTFMNIVLNYFIFNHVNVLSIKPPLSSGLTRAGHSRKGRGRVDVLTIRVLFPVPPCHVSLFSNMLRKGRKPWGSEVLTRLVCLLSSMWQAPKCWLFSPLRSFRWPSRDNSLHLDGTLNMVCSLVFGLNFRDS